MSCTDNEKWKNAKIVSLDTVRKNKENRIIEYNKNPSRCNNCNSSLEYSKRNNKYCSSSCSATKNNLGINRHNTDTSKTCKCGVVFNSKGTYCSSSCYSYYAANNTYLDWLVNYASVKKLPSGVRRVLILKANNKCSLCGWGEINKYSGNYSLILDHIDGNSENNSPNNLRIICPNCDSLLPTYKALNKGKGRSSRMFRYYDGKSY